MPRKSPKPPKAPIRAHNPRPADETRNLARKGRRPGRGADHPPQPKPAANPPASTTKAALVLAALQRQDGATLDELMAATGWQAHSVRGFLSGLRKRGLVLTRVASPGAASRYQASAVDGR